MQTGTRTLKMMAVTININAQNFINGLHKLNSEYPETAQKIAVEFAEESNKISRQGIIPVITGNLRSTARVEKTEQYVKFIIGGIQGSGSPSLFVNYASFVNWGTSRQLPQFFMERSVNIAADRLDSFSKLLLDNWLSNIKS